MGMCIARALVCAGSCPHTHGDVYRTHTLGCVSHTQHVIVYHMGMCIVYHMGMCIARALVCAIHIPMCIAHTPCLYPIYIYIYTSHIYIYMGCVSHTHPTFLACVHVCMCACVDE